MKIKQIAKDHIEVTVTKLDLTSFNMDIDSLTPDSPKLKTFLCNMMECVRNKTGFDPQSGHVFVEAQRRDDKIIFNIKRMGRPIGEMRKKFKNARAVLKASAARVYIYGFEHFSDMTDALRLIDRDMLPSCSVYRFDGVYYCSFRTAKGFDKYGGILSEFCSVHDRYEFTDAILAEHGECIAKGKGVVSLIDGIKRYDL